MSERYFDNDDKLGRKRYAEFLKWIISSSGYKQENIGNSNVIAVDSSWGTGKTYFIDMFENYLLGKERKNTSNPNDDFIVIRFDAWKNDFWNNAFEPLVIAILENDYLYPNMVVKDSIEFIKGIISAGASIVKGVVKKKLDDYIDSDSLEKATNDFSGNIKNFLIDEQNIFKEYQQYKKSICDFKCALSEIINGEKKVVVIIDELDRCKPSFAIQLLEIIKHMFDIAGITFLFMLDIEQLSYSIKTIYGHEMDATGYLCRFFNYITRMPKAEVKVYIADSLNRIEWSKLNDEGAFDERFIENVSEFIYDMYQCYNLSLRDIDICINSYKIMIDMFLSQYIYFSAHIIYLFYLIIKHKKIYEFNDMFFKGILPSKQDERIIQKYQYIEESMDCLEMIISEIDWDVYTKEKGNRLCINPIEALTINYVKQEEMYLRGKSGREFNLTYRLDGKIRLNNILFVPDIKKWDQIKNMRYGQYIHQQLEMFNLVEFEMKRNI